MNAGRDGKKAQGHNSKKIARPYHHQKSGIPHCLGGPYGRVPESSRPPGHGPTVDFFRAVFGPDNEDVADAARRFRLHQDADGGRMIEDGDVEPSLIASFASTCTLRRYARPAAGARPTSSWSVW
jgi:hypothetical protein